MDVGQPLGGLACPTCRKRHPIFSVAQLSTNYELLDVVDQLLALQPAPRHSSLPRLPAGGRAARTPPTPPQVRTATSLRARRFVSRPVPHGAAPAVEVLGQAGGQELSRYTLTR